MEFSKTLYGLIGLIISASIVNIVICDNEPTPERFSIRQRISEKRLQILKDNAELSELHERIIKLQKILIEKLDNHPEMKPLISEMEKLEGHKKHNHNDNLGGK